MERFCLISPQRWYSSRLAVLLLGPIPLVAAILVWVGPSTIKDHSGSAATGFFGFFLAFEAIWLFALIRGCATNRDPKRNYVELSTGEMTVAWNGQRKSLMRGQIRTYAVHPDGTRLEGALRAFSWMPARAYVELIFESPVRFSFMTLTGNWRAQSIPIETDDVDAFRRSLDAWLSSGLPAARSPRGAD